MKRGIFSAVFSMLCVWEVAVAVAVFLFYFCCSFSSLSALRVCFSTFCLLLYTTIWVARCGFTYKTPCVDSMPIAVAIEPLHHGYIHIHTQRYRDRAREKGHGCEIIRTLSHVNCLFATATYPKWHKQIIYFCWLHYKLRRVTLQHVSVCCCVLISVCFL